LISSSSSCGYVFSRFPMFVSGVISNEDFFISIHY
jgi:hypothetical protein